MMYNEPFYTPEQKLVYANHTAEGILFEYTCGLAGGRIYFSTEYKFSLEKFASAIAQLTSHIHFVHMPRMNGFSGWDTIKFEQIKEFGVVRIYETTDGNYEVVDYHDTLDDANAEMTYYNGETRKHWSTIFIRQETEYGYTRLDSRIKSKRNKV